MVWNGRLVMSVGFVVVFAVAVGLALGYSSPAKLLPLMVGLPGLLLALLSVWQELRKKGGENSHSKEAESLHEEVATDQPKGSAQRRELQMVSWVLGFLLLIISIGLVWAIGFFTLAYLKFQGKYSWLFSMLFALVTSLFIYFVFREGFKIPLYPGVLFH